MTSNSSKTDRGAAPPPRRLLVGRVARPHGVRGEVVVDNESDVEGRFAPGERFFWEAGSRRGPARMLEIESVREGGGAANRLLVRFAGIGDREAAVGIQGGDLEIEADRAAPAPRGSFYPHELIGCAVVDERLGDLGRIEEIRDAGGGPLLVVRQERRELLIPFVEAFVRRFDPAEGRLEVVIPEGLVEVCASRS